MHFSRSPAKAWAVGGIDDATREKAAALARDNGWSGLVINGVIRDAALIGDIELGVKALGVTPLRSSKTGAGAIDVPVVFGDALFEPGDWLYCDRDGVLVAKAPLSLAAASE